MRKEKENNSLNFNGICHTGDHDSNNVSTNESLEEIFEETFPVADVNNGIENKSVVEDSSEYLRAEYENNGGDEHYHSNVSDENINNLAYFSSEDEKVSHLHVVSPINNHSHNHSNNDSRNQSHTHSHTHSHAFGHNHSHDDINFAKQRKNRFRLILVLFLTLSVGIAEIAVSIYSGSLALLADSGHMFADSLGLIFALVIAYIMAKPGDEKHTWGYKRAEVLGALGQSVILSAVGIYIVISAINRLLVPNEIESGSMGIMGIIGLVVNGFSIIILLSSRNENMNMGAAFLEVLADTLGSVGVVVAAILINVTGITVFDIIVSSIIAVFIVIRAISMGNKATNILLETVPEGIDLKVINEHVSSIDHVIEMHDIHVSMISTDLYVLSAHVVVEEECFTDNHSRIILDQVQHCLANHFNVPIKHVTIQLESPHHIEHEYNPCNS